MYYFDKTFWKMLTIFLLIVLGILLLIMGVNYSTQSSNSANPQVINN